MGPTSLLASAAWGVLCPLYVSHLFSPVGGCRCMSRLGRLAGRLCRPVGRRIGVCAERPRTQSERERSRPADLAASCAGTAQDALNNFGTLTYGPPFCRDPEQLRRDLAVFWRSLRTALGGRAFPYVWVPEWHKPSEQYGERLHAHFAVGCFIKQALIRDKWGHGHVFIKRLTDLPVGSTTRHEARTAAGYLSKYVTKSFDTDLRGMHRYDVAQGFQPVAQRIEGRSPDEVLDRACSVMRAQPAVRWSSADSADWVGPPAVWFAWD